MSGSERYGATLPTTPTPTASSCWPPCLQYPSSHHRQPGRRFASCPPVPAVDSLAPSTPGGDGTTRPAPSTSPRCCQATSITVTIYISPSALLISPARSHVTPGRAREAGETYLMYLRRQLLKVNPPVNFQLRLPILDPSFFHGDSVDPFFLAPQKMVPAPAAALHARDGVPGVAVEGFEVYLEEGRARGSGGSDGLP